MTLSSILLGAVLASAANPAAPAAGFEGPIIRWDAPATYVTGSSYDVTIEIEAPKGGTVVASWLLSPSAFSVDGTPLAKREDAGTLSLPSGFKIQGKVDLGPMIDSQKAFKLSYADDIADTEPVEVGVYQPSPGGLDFMSMPAEELGDYLINLRTNRGDILLRVWPDAAPNHVRNFLDLAYTDFYDGTTFHRVIENFMIQGGDPTGTGGGTGPRNLTLEVADKPHLPGVLSMARTEAPDGASCQFFIVHRSARHLDGKYTAFGEVVSGMDTVDRIATTPVAGASRPREPQVIERATVVRAIK